MGIGKDIEQFARLNGEKPAILLPDGEQITYKQFYHHIRNLQMHMKTASNKKKQTVGIWIGNDPEFLEVFFAVITLGWIAVPFDPKWTKKEVKQVMEDCAPDLCIASKSFLKRSQYFPERVVMIDEWKRLERPVENDIQVKWESFDEEIFYLGFTSGSTGRQKGYMRNHRSWLKSFYACEEVFGYGEEDVIVAPGPLCHSLSLFAAVHALHIGATFYMLPVFSPKETYNILKERKATVFYGVPTMLEAMLKLPVGKEDSIKQPVKMITSGAKLSSATRQKIKDILPNGQVFEFYGASELSFVSYSDEQIFKQAPGSVGIPFPGVNVTIKKEDGSEALPNEIGEVVVSSEFLFSGYVNSQNETNSVFRDDGVSIGDLGYLDENGFLTIVGRKKNMIISGGFNIYPEEIEIVLKKRKEVEEAVVIGAKDDYWGQKPVAFIKWKKGAKAESFRSLKRYLKTELPLHKIPRKFYEVEQFPYTTSGKIARNKLEQLIKEVGK